MRTICDPAELAQLKAKALLLMFGGAGCAVCLALKPRLEALRAAEFPALAAAYVDCQGAGVALCAQQGIFALPVVQVWFEGRKYAEFGRVFALEQLREAIARPYRLTLG